MKQLRKLPRLRSLTKGRRITLYLQDALWRVYKKKQLPLSKILQEGVRNYLTEGEDKEFHFALNRKLKQKLAAIKKICESED